MTLPTPEPRFDLHFRGFDTNDQLETLKKSKNIIIAAALDDSTNTSRWIRSMLSDKAKQQVRNGKVFAFPLGDKWYQNQWAIIFTAPDDSALAVQIHNSSTSLTDRLLDKEMKRWKYEIYEKGEQKNVEDSLWKKQGWKIRVQHDWIKSLDTTYTHNGEENHFFTMRRVLPTNDRWFWAWWKGGVKNMDFLSDDWINAKRDSLNEHWIRGTRDSSYITTEYGRPVKSHSFKFNGHIAYETLGTWRMTHDAMGGPFANLTVYDDETNRLFMLEFGQFAPKFKKRRFVRQFRTMLRTFKSDSAWSSESDNDNSE